MLTSSKASSAERVHVPPPALRSPLQISRFSRPAHVPGRCTVARLAGCCWNRDPCSDQVALETLFRCSCTRLSNSQRLIISLESLTSRLDDLPNSHVSPFDAAFPGTLPVSSYQLSILNSSNRKLAIESQFEMRRPRSADSYGTQVQDLQTLFL